MFLLFSGLLERKLLLASNSYLPGERLLPAFDIDDGVGVRTDPLDASVVVEIHGGDPEAESFSTMPITAQVQLATEGANPKK